MYLQHRKQQGGCLFRNFQEDVSVTYSGGRLFIQRVSFTRLLEYKKLICTISLRLTRPLGSLPSPLSLIPSHFPPRCSPSIIAITVSSLPFPFSVGSNHRGKRTLDLRPRSLLAPLKEERSDVYAGDGSGRGEG